MRVVSAIKPIAYRVLCGLGADHWMRRHASNKLVILCYHGVAPNQWQGPPSWLVMPADKFERQVTYLRDNFDVVPMSLAARKIRDQQEFDRPTACITFDDGYKNNFTVAYPILKRLGLPATIYLATGGIGTGDILWMPRLERAMVTSRRPYVDLRDLGLGLCCMGPGRPQSFVSLVTTLYRRPREQREDLLEAIISRIDGEKDGDMSPFELMTWDDVATLGRTGLIEFGGHTVTHQVLAPLSDVELRREVADSIKAVAWLTGGDSTTFAYPNGSWRDFDDRAKKLLEELGITAALSTIDGLNGPQTDRYALRRITVGSGIDDAEFRLRASGMISAIKDALRWRGSYAATRADDAAREWTTSSSNVP